MPSIKNQEMTITTGWGQGQKCRFVQFAEGEGGLMAEHVGPNTTVITAMPRRGDAIVEVDGRHYACYFRSLDPFPARIIVVQEDLCSCENLDDVANLPQIADLGIKFLPKDHKTVCSRLKRLVRKYGKFCWVHYGYHAAVLVVGVTPAS